MKKTPKETRWLKCWCGHSAQSHPHYVEYTGYVCTECDRCNDFGLTANDE
jgi:hypothetical protein